MSKASFIQACVGMKHLITIIKIDARALDFKLRFSKLTNNTVTSLTFEELKQQ